MQSAFRHFIGTKEKSGFQIARLNVLVFPRRLCYFWFIELLTARY